MKLRDAREIRFRNGIELVNSKKSLLGWYGNFNRQKKPSQLCKLIHDMHSPLVPIANCK